MSQFSSQEIPTLFSEDRLLVQPLSKLDNKWDTSSTPYCHVVLVQWWDFLRTPLEKIEFL